MDRLAYFTVGDQSCPRVIVSSVECMTVMSVLCMNECVPGKCACERVRVRARLPSMECVARCACVQVPTPLEAAKCRGRAGRRGPARRIPQAGFRGGQV